MRAMSTILVQIHMGQSGGLVPYQVSVA